VAEAFGGAGERVESLGDFENAVRRAVASMDSGIPYAINAVIGKSEFRKGSISM
jgi:acetolactate synthase-1/2/3 large subunit/acetolactate synthase-like protein